jgi:hypothetical protein
MNHGVARHEPAELSDATLKLVDEHTSVDAQLFAEALRLLIGRLRTVQEATGNDLLSCMPWRKLHQASGHIPGLWGADASAFAPSGSER